MGLVGPRRFDVVLVRFDPTEGSEIRKTRPSVVVSPDEMNAALRTLIVAPMTTGGHSYPWRVDVVFQGRDGRIAVDQIRTIDKSRVMRRLGSLGGGVAERTLETLTEMFAP